MRSPSGACFPAPYAVVLHLACALVLGACTSDDPPRPDDAARPTAADAGPASPTSEPTDDHPAGQRGERAPVVVTDKDSRRTVRGTAPPYVEIRTASVAASLDALRLRTTLEGKLPLKMPNDRSVLRVSYMLTMRDGRRFTFDAQCVRAGWGVFATGGPEDAPLPELAIEGPRLEIAVDPAYIGGPQPFDWLASVAWTEGAANYAFDAAPKTGTASFP